MTIAAFAHNGRLALIAPASPVSDNVLRTTLAAFDQLGLDYQLGRQVGARHRYLAGNVEQRLEDLYAAFADPEVSAVWCLRGGYGCGQLLPHIDWQRLKRASVRPLIGFSDISLLLSAFHRQGLPAIHGPQAGALGQLASAPASEHSDRLASLASLQALLQQQPGSFALQQVAGPSQPVEGQLIGGNLTALASGCGWQGSLYVPDKAILLLEDVGEKYYRLERSFQQLWFSLEPARIQAVCLGHFTDCPRDNVSQSLEEIVAEYLEPLGIPLYNGLPVGHGSENHAWPYGRMARLANQRLEW